jgi:hypothetical protein
MSDSQDPIYVSPRSWRNLWQQYRIYPDRIELECWFALHTLIIPAEGILNVEVRPRLVVADLFRGKRFAYSFPLKMDLADMRQHVAMRRKSGFMKHLRFTPDNPDKFVETCKSIMKKA